MFFRPITYRSFLYPEKYNTDAVSWEVSCYDEGNGKNTYYLDIRLSNSGSGYSLHTAKHNGQSVSAALKPLNDLIASLCKASMEFAKACNTPEANVKIPVNNKKPKASKSEKPKK